MNLQSKIPHSTIVESNVLYESPRRETMTHRETIKTNGFDFCPVDILDEDGDVMLPIPGLKEFLDKQLDNHTGIYPFERDCAGATAAKPTCNDIGIIGSTDILAADQACIDLIYQMPADQRHDIVERIESRLGLHQLEYMEILGIGSRKYNLIHPKAQRGEAKFHQTNSPYFSFTGLNGHFAEYSKCIDADMNLAIIPDSITDIEAVMVPDMVGTAFTGVEQMHIGYGDTVVILGIGPVGLMGVAGVALKGAGRIIAVGSRPNTKELAKYYGANHIIDYHDGDVNEQVMKLTKDEPVDSVLIASGGNASEQYALGLKLVKWGGHVSNVSGFFHDEIITLPHELFFFGVDDKHFHTSLVQDGRELVERLLKLIEYKKLDTKAIATPILHGWDQLEKGLELMQSRNPDVIKPVILID